MIKESTQSNPATDHSQAFLNPKFCATHEIPAASHAVLSLRSAPSFNPAPAATAWALSPSPLAPG
jgi:hypothetical protein